MTKATPDLPILQEIHAELSLWQKIKLLAKIYWRYFVESVPVKFLVFFFGVPLVMVFKRKQVKVAASEIMAEELGQKIIELESSASVEIDRARQEWNGQLVLELGGNLYEYCTDADLDRWYKYGLNPGEVVRIVNQRQDVNDKPKKKSPKAAPLTPNYYTGSVPQGSYYVDLRWDTIANGEVNYKDFWK